MWAERPLNPNEIELKHPIDCSSCSNLIDTMLRQDVWGIEGILRCLVCPLCYSPLLSEPTATTAGWRI